jgi:hypothetical protein
MLKVFFCISHIGGTLLVYLSSSSFDSGLLMLGEVLHACRRHVEVWPGALQSVTMIWYAPAASSFTIPLCDFKPSVEETMGALFTEAKPVGSLSTAMKAGHASPIRTPTFVSLGLPRFLNDQARQTSAKHMSSNRK